MAGREAAAGPNVLHLALPGTSGNYVSTPDSVAASVTSDIDIRVKATMTDWTPAATGPLVAKFGAAGSRSYRIFVDTTGKLNLNLSEDGTNSVSAVSSVATGIADGAVKWVRATWRNSDERAQFFTSDDGSSWTQLGTNVTLPAIAAIHDNANAVTIGVLSSVSTTTTLAGNIYYVEIRSGIDGTVVLSFDPTTVTRTAVRTPTTAAAGGTAGGTWTMNGTGWDWAVA